MNSIYIDEGGNISGYIPPDTFSGRYYRADEVDALVAAARCCDEILITNPIDLSFIIKLKAALKPFMEVT